MTALGVAIFCAITGMFITAALLIIKGGRPEVEKSLQPALHVVADKRMR